MKRITSLLVPVAVSTLVACAGSSASDAADTSIGAATASDVHSPAVGSPERTAIFDAIRREFDAEVQSHPAAGTKDVEFNVSGPDGILRVGSRNAVSWAFVAALAMTPGTSQGFDYSHAPHQIQLEAQDEEGHPDNRIIAILKQDHAGWHVVTDRGFPELYFAPTDVAWEDMTCKNGAPFGVLEGAIPDAASCGTTAPPKVTCNKVKTEELTQVPSDKLGDVIKGYNDDGAMKVTTTPDGSGTFTVDALFPDCN